MADDDKTEEGEDVAEKKDKKQSKAASEQADESVNPPALGPHVPQGQTEPEPVQASGGDAITAVEPQTDDDLQGGK